MEMQKTIGILADRRAAKPPNQTRRGRVYHIYVIPVRDKSGTDTWAW